jgi:hypothetical protein
MIGKTVLAGVIVAGATLFSVEAQAAVVTETYDFTLGDFVDPYAGATAPTSTVTASFTLTFDPSVAYTDETSGVTVNELSVPLDSAVGFSTFPGSTPSDPYFISIGGIEHGAGVVYGGTNDFVLQLEFANEASLGSPTLPLCSDSGYICGPAPPDSFASGYTSSGYPSSFFVATSASVAVAVPEPAAWAMMLVGLAGLGVASRSRRRPLAGAL